MRLTKRTIILTGVISGGANRTLLSGLISRPCTVRQARVSFALGAGGMVSVRLMKCGTEEAPTAAAPFGDDLVTAESGALEIVGDAETRQVNLGRFLKTGGWYMAAYCVNGDGNDHRVYCEIDLEFQTEGE